jgi:hypothetical protein
LATVCASTPRCIDDQQRPFAGGERARYLIREIDMPGSIDQVQIVARPVARDVLQRRGLGLDGDAPLALEVHGVQDLSFHLAIGQPAAALDEAVGERRLAMVDVGDNREIADVLH